MAVIWFAYACRRFNHGDFVWASVFIVSSTILQALALRGYRQVWEITKEGEIFKVIRNRKILFEWPSMDLASVTTDFRNDSVDPFIGRMFQVPKEVANDVFLDLIKSRDEKEHSC